VTHVTLALLLGLAQHVHHDGATAHRPVALLPGMGSYTLLIQASSPEAQKYFDQGLMLLYGFNRFEAFRSFEKASQLDPSNSWPKIGLALSKAPFINMDMDGDVDMAFYCRTLDGLKHPWAAALRSRCPAGDDQAYIRAMKALAAANPDDLDVQTLYAEALMIPTRWKWFDKEYRPAPGIEEAIEVLERVLRRDPNHPGANHYYIHAVESSSTPEYAIPAAQRLMGIVPGAGHLVHMPGHIWLATGDYEMSAAVNERAVEVDRDYLDRTNVRDSSYYGYYLHNLHFIAASRMMQGRKGDALKAARELTQAIGPMAQAMPDMVDSFVPYEWLMLARFGEWNAVMAIADPGETLPASRAMWRYVRTLALLAMGRDATAERKLFEAAKAKIPASSMWQGSPSMQVAELAGHILDARMSKDVDQRLTHWRAAVALQDGLAYMEPPPWPVPVRESLAAELIRARRAADAEEVLRLALRRQPRDGRLLFLLKEALRAQKKIAAADSVDREFQQAWRRADTALTIDAL
jgi:tetratricopeptide (TPR) repeat protein